MKPTLTGHRHFQIAVYASRASCSYALEEWHTLAFGNFFNFPSQGSNAIIAESARKITHTAPTFGPAVVALAGPIPTTLFYTVILKGKVLSHISINSNVLVYTQVLCPALRPYYYCYYPLFACVLCYDHNMLVLCPVFIYCLQYSVYWCTMSFGAGLRGCCGFSSFDPLNKDTIILPRKLV